MALTSTFNVKLFTGTHQQLPVVTDKCSDIEDTTVVAGNRSDDPSTDTSPNGYEDSSTDYSDETDSLVDAIDSPGDDANQLVGDRRRSRGSDSYTSSEEFVVITVPQPIPKNMSGSLARRQPFSRSVPSSSPNPFGTGGKRGSNRQGTQRDYSRVRMVIGQDTTVMVPVKKVRPIFRGPLHTVDLYHNKQLRAGVIVYVEIPGQHKSQLFFCLGLDQRTGDITDFGGGVTKKDPTALHAALREFHEETLGIFADQVPLTPMVTIPFGNVGNGVITMADPSGHGVGVGEPAAMSAMNLTKDVLHPQLKDALAIWSDRSLVVFVKLDPRKLTGSFSSEGPHNWSGFMRSFVDRYQTAKKSINEPEVSNIVWVTRHDLETMIGRKAVGDHRMYDRIRSLLNGGGQFYDLL